jgi:hypothetical protein
MNLLNELKKTWLQGTRQAAEEPTPIRAFIINPVARSITPVDRGEPVESLIDKIVGLDAVSEPLDKFNNVWWYSDTDTTSPAGYYFERIGIPPFCTRRFSYGLIVSLGPTDQWNEDTIAFYLRWYNKKNVWGDL